MLNALGFSTIDIFGDVTVLLPSAPEEMNFNPLLCGVRGLWQQYSVMGWGVRVQGKGSAMMFNACSKMFENKRDIFN